MSEISFRKPANVAAVYAMAQELRRRSPDGGGIFSQDHLCLGHRRLQIIDLSGASQQPMVDAALGLSIAFNGCIYYYQDLREELRGLGYRFFSEGDTEARTGTPIIPIDTPGVPATVGRCVG